MSTADDNNTEEQPEIGSDAWWQALQERRIKDRLDSANRLKETCPALASLGITNIVWSYNGDGDSASMEAVEITGRGTAPKTIDEVKAAFKGFDAETQSKLDFDKMEDDVWRLLPEGFENNEGGWGEVELYTNSREVQVRHHQRIVEFTYDEETL